MSTSPEMPIPHESIGIEVVPQTPQIPEHIEKGGVVAQPHAFTAQVKDDQGTNLITPGPASVTISIPQDLATLEVLAKGDISSARTWIAAYFLRSVKKAVKNGWQVVVGKDN